MKRLFLTLLFTTAAAIISHAQTINFGVKAGLNLSEQIHAAGDDEGHSFLTGGNAGAIIDIGFKNFSIQPGIFFSMKGENDKSKYAEVVPLSNNPGGGGAGEVPSVTRLYYIEVPVNFLYKFNLAPGANIHLGGGPYIAHGFSQHEVVNGNPTQNQIFDYQNPDLGVDALAGITFKHILFDAQFSYGIANIEPAPIASSTIASHNMVTSFSVGYMFK